MRHNSKCPACIAEALEVFSESPANPGHSEISEYVLKLALLQLFMENWYCIFRTIFCSNLEKNVSTLVFCHEKLIIGTFFTRVAIINQNWVYFFTPSTPMIAHSALMLTRWRRVNLIKLKTWKVECSNSKLKNRNDTSWIES